MAKSNSSNHHKDISIFSHASSFFIRLFGWALLGWMITLIISFFLLKLYGEVSGINYLATLSNSQLVYLAKNSGPSLISKAPFKTAEGILQSTKKWLLVKSKLISFAFNKQQPKLLNDLTPQQYMDFSYAAIKPYLKAFLLSTELTILRIVIAFFMLPLFLLLGAIGFIDGLVQRDIRKFSGGRESALIYHRAKRYILPIFMASFFIYLVLPLPISPQWLFLPVAILFSMAVAITTRSFKKYV